MTEPRPAPSSKAVPIMHKPAPGPMYWDFRCLICSEPVRDHAPFWRRVLHRLTGGSK